MDAIDRRESAPSASLDALVASLREIHGRRRADPKWRPVAAVAGRVEESGASAWRGHDGAADRRGAELLARAVDALRRIHDRTPRAVARDRDRGAVGVRSYDSIRELFRTHEDELRRRARLTDRILDQLRRGDGPARIPAAAPLQQDLRVACHAGGASGGRFVVTNETTAPQEVRFQVGRLRGAGAGAGDRLTLAFDPEPLLIAPGESRIVRVSVDLGALPPQAGQRIEVPIDCRGRRDSLGRLWLELVIATPDPGPAEGERR